MARVQYTVSSHGRPIGVTDLGFAPRGGRSRSGWFMPNTDGDALLPRLATGLPAMRIYLHRDVLGEDGQSIVQPDFVRSTLFADLAEHFQHAAAFGLALHREDGSLVPTELVGIQDFECPLTESDWGEASPDESDDGPEWDPNDRLWGDDDDLACPICRGLGIELGAMRDDDEDATGSVPTWMPELEFPMFPRYQIHVALVDAGDPRDALPPA
jgi:hypothetical protein